MTKRRWKCHDGISIKILNIIKSNNNITTSGIILKLKELGSKVSWKLTDSYLTELESNKKIKRVRIGDKHKINFWNIL